MRRAASSSLDMSRYRKMIFALLCIATCVAVFSIWKQNVVLIAVQWSQIRTVGPLATNCGFVDANYYEADNPADRSGVEAANACMNGARQNSRPFRVTYQFWGKDSQLTQGFIGDSTGHLSVTGYDSISDGSPWASLQLNARHPYLIHRLPFVPCPRVEPISQRRHIPDCRFESADSVH